MSQFRVPGYLIVTGGGGGIGKEIGLTFAECGAKGVLFADINVEFARLAAETSKTIALNGAEYKTGFVEVDVRDSRSIGKMVEVAMGLFGRVDYCVNAAGISHQYSKITDFEEEVFDRVMDVNARGTYLVCKAVIRVMREQDPLVVQMGRHGPRDLGRGCIVNVASAQANAAVEGKSAYVTSKHALTGITRSCAVECRPYCIRVNQLAPTWVRSPMFDWECQKAPSVPALIEKIVPNGRPAEADEIASAALYLCSPGGGYISGQSLTIDYGLSAGPPAFN